MKREAGLKWLFMDLNSYFASVEQQENPRLRGRPVIVVPVETDATCAIAASREAKLYGIRTGTPVYEAKKMCPGLACVLARHDVYVDYHHRILEEVVRHTPINRVWSIDELSSRLPPGRRGEEAARDVVRRLKDGLRRNIGEAVTCSVGLAPNSLLAKMASDVVKPDGLTIFRPEDLTASLFPLRLTDIPGVGHNMQARLARAGIWTIQDLWRIPPKQARKIWGSVQGERLWYWLHGYDFDAPETGSVMVGHSRVLDPDLRHPARAREIARRLLVKAATRLRGKEFYADTLSLGARTVDGYRWSGARRTEAAQDPFTFLAALDELWASMMVDLAGRRGTRLLKVSVILDGLRRQQEITGDLFDAARRAQDPAAGKNEALTRALDHLQQKYKKEVVCVGVTPRTAAGHVGTKIAFSRVPEREEFWS